MLFGNRIKELREEQGLLQRQYEQVTGYVQPPNKVVLPLTSSFMSFYGRTNIKKSLVLPFLLLTAAPEF